MSDEVDRAVRRAFEAVELPAERIDALAAMVPAAAAPGGRTDGRPGGSWPWATVALALAVAATLAVALVPAAPGLREAAGGAVLREAPMSSLAVALHDDDRVTAGPAFAVVHLHVDGIRAAMPVEVLSVDGRQAFVRVPSEAVPGLLDHAAARRIRLLQAVPPDAARRDRLFRVAVAQQVSAGDRVDLTGADGLLAHDVPVVEADGAVITVRVTEGEAVRLILARGLVDAAVREPGVEVVVLTADGEATIGGGAVSDAALGELLRQRAAEHPTVMIRPQPGTPEHRIAEVFEIARSAGIERVAIPGAEPEGADHR